MTGRSPRIPGRRTRFTTSRMPWSPAGPATLAWEAKRALERLVLGRRVTLSFGGRRMDRHGRLLAHMHAADGAWIQGEMLRSGLARVYSFADNRALIPEMLYARQSVSRWNFTPRYVDGQPVEARIRQIIRYELHD